MPHTHNRPSDCLVNLDFEFDDGGSRECWGDILRKDRHKARAGDCSVIAASLALEQWYEETLSTLQFMTRFRKQNVLRFKQEIRKGGLGGLLRSLREQGHSGREPMDETCGHEKPVDSVRRRMIPAAGRRYGSTVRTVRRLPSQKSGLRNERTTPGCWPRRCL